MWRPPHVFSRISTIALEAMPCTFAFMRSAIAGCREDLSAFSYLLCTGVFEITLHMQLPISISEVAYAQHVGSCRTLVCAHMNAVLARRLQRIFYLWTWCCRVGIPRLPDTGMTSGEQYEDMLVCFFCHCCSLAGILSVFEKSRTVPWIRKCYQSLHPQSRE